MRRNRLLAAALILTATFGLTNEALAREVTVQVDAGSGPWSPAVNAKVMPFGVGDAKPATVVPFDVGGGKIGIYAEGTTSVPGTDGIEAVGIENDAVDDKLYKKKRYPSFYTPKILYPANRHALVAAFVDEKGVVLGRPFVVGKGVRVSIPDGAAAVSIGFNDAVSKGNSGSLNVTLDIPD